MNRRLFCIECGLAWALHPEDERAGFSFRRCRLRVRKPENLTVVTSTYANVSAMLAGDIPDSVEADEVSTLRCDDCNIAVADGSEMFAVTVWNEQREREPGDWESEYAA